VKLDNYENKIEYGLSPDGLFFYVISSYYEKGFPEGKILKIYSVKTSEVVYEKIYLGQKLYDNNFFNAYWDISSNKLFFLYCGICNIIDFKTGISNNYSNMEMLFINDSDNYCGNNAIGCFFEEEQNSLTVLDMGNFIEVSEPMSYPAQPIKICFSENQSNLLVLYSNNDIVSWNYINGKKNCVLKGKDSHINSISWAVDCKRLLISTPENMIIAYLNDVKLKSLNNNANNSIHNLFNHTQDEIIDICWTTEEWPYVNKWNIISGNYSSIWSSFYGREAKYSPNGKMIMSIAADNIKIVDAISYEILYSINAIQDGMERVPSDFPYHRDYIFSANWNNYSDRIITTSADNTARIWSLSSNEFEKKINHDDYVVDAKWSPNSNLVATVSKGSIFLWDSEKYNFFNEIKMNDSSRVNRIDWSPDSKFIVCGNDNGSIKVIDVYNGSMFSMQHSFSQSNINNILWSNNSEMLVSNDHKTICFWNSYKGKLLSNLKVFDNGEYIFFTEDKYYSTTKNTTSLIYWIVDNTKIYSFEQFDLKYNRPDIVLERLGYADSTLIEAYHKAYLKRLKKMGFTEEQLSGEFHIPESAIENFEYMPVIDEKNIDLDLNFNDSKYKLERYNIWINDVAVFGTYGKSLRDLQTQSHTITEKIELSEGRNKIQVSCLNEKGAESYKETVEITYTPKTPEKHDLYFVAVSVSEYEDAQFNLKYAVKDGRDMVNLFAANKQNEYAHVYIDTLFNEMATTENLIGVKQRLLNSYVNDEVILYVSGHGLLDDNLDFYFASHNIDFSNPAVNGISYDTLEGLLDGIPARKKLLLMDACHSGEVDKDDTHQEADSMVLLANGQKSGLKTYSYKGAVMKHSSDPNKIGLQNSFDLMQELFANLNRGSGAVVISAAAGVGYALEGEQWNNGVFTYTILDGLANGYADSNGDKQVSVTELREYVINQVDRLTNGRQKPTSRQENLEFEWRVW
jgi:WD40 repeat protein